jgi:hypothetical protein
MLLMGKSTNFLWPFSIAKLSEDKHHWIGSREKNTGKPWTRPYI